jgi:hypothetical protein
VENDFPKKANDVKSLEGAKASSDYGAVKSAALLPERPKEAIQHPGKRRRKKGRNAQETYEQAADGAIFDDLASGLVQDVVKEQ